MGQVRDMTVAPELTYSHGVLEVKGEIQKMVGGGFTDDQVWRPWL
jgi:hypothetical protein